MGMDLWFQDDVRRILWGLARAASRYDPEYRQVYLDALGDVATAFGLMEESPTGKNSQNGTEGGSRCSLLGAVDLHAGTG